MVTGRICPTHPTRTVTATCRRCAIPICDQCELENAGRFCSRQCAEQFKNFQGAVRDEFVVPRRRFSLIGCLRTAAISTILLLVTAAALYQLFGTLNPTQIVEELRNMLRLIF